MTQTLLVNTGYVIMLIALIVEDILWLRITMVLAQSLDHFIQYHDLQPDGVVLEHCVCLDQFVSDRKTRYQAPPCADP